MGLHESILDVPERLRVWQLAGVRYFYNDPDPAAAVALADEPATPIPDTPVPAAAQIPEVASPAPLVLPDVRDDPKTWREPWPGLFAKAPPAPRLVLTYDALGEDMTGQADPRRGPMWRSLLGKCGLVGKGLVAFWPLRLPREDDPDYSLAVFLSGLRLLRPALLAVFGQEPAKRLGRLPEASVPCSLRFLPDPLVLLQGDKEVWDHVASILSRL
jgi:hypothetical protein